MEQTHINRGICGVWTCVLEILLGSDSGSTEAGKSSPPIKYIESRSLTVIADYSIW